MKAGDIKIFKKSGNKVRLLHLSEDNTKEWIVERVKGVSKGKQMICKEKSLVDSLD